MFPPLPGWLRRVGRERGARGVRALYWVQMTKNAQILALTASLLLPAPVRADAPKASVERLRVKVLETFPHDRGAFTQGLLWYDGSLYESTGQYGQATLRRVEPRTGKVLERVDLDRALFGEGLAKVGDRLIQLTWQEGLALVYEIDGLIPVDQLTYDTHGWGLAWDGKRLMMTDGSDQLTFRDPETFRKLGSVRVTLNGFPLRGVNELEMANGQLYANVWGHEQIYRIDPETGRVGAVIDASGLLGVMEKARADVLNGIAWDPDSESFWITGKYWPKMFRVVFVSATDV